MFQWRVNFLFEGIPGTFLIGDDIKVQEATELKHDIEILETCDHTKQVQLVFNPDKCSIKQKEIKYYINIVGRSSVKPDPAKIQAIQALQVPQDKQELQSFLGMINYLTRVILHLGEKRELL